MKVLAIACCSPPLSVRKRLRATLKRGGLWQKMSEQERVDFLERGVCYDTEPGRRLAANIERVDRIRKLLGWELPNVTN